MSETDWVDKPIKWKKWMAWGTSDKGNNNPVKETNPGIYIISIKNHNENLEGTEPNYKDVNYIGMTNSKEGLKQRLNQFDTAIRGLHGHSGGNGIYRGFKKDGKKIEGMGNYNNWKKRLRLFVSYSEVKCMTQKGERTVNDLLMMGKCTYLEYKALAECKKATGEEPKYNKK